METVGQPLTVRNTFPTKGRVSLQKQEGSTSVPRLTSPLSVCFVMVMCNGITVCVSIIIYNVPENFHC